MSVQNNNSIKNKLVGEERNLNTLDDLLEGCQVIGYDWRYLYVNSVAAKQGHREPEELLHHTMMEMYPGIDNTELFTVMHDCMINRVAHQMENNFTYPDGTNGWFELSIQPVPEGIFILSVDITQRKRAESKVIQLTHLYATLSQVNQTIVRVKEPGELYRSICNVVVEYGRFELAWIGLLDESTGDIKPFAANGLDVAKWPFQGININQNPFKDGLIATAIRTSQVCVSNDIQVDKRIMFFQEQFRDFVYHSSAVIPFNLNGKSIGVLNLVSGQPNIFTDDEEVNLLNEMGMDISFALASIQTENERKSAEIALKASEDNYRSLVENSESAIVVLDHDGQILYANSWAIKVWNDPKIVGKTIYQIYPEEYAKAYLKAIRKVIHAQTTIIDELESLIKDRVMWFRISLTPLRNSAGIVDKVLLNAWDITERKQAEEAISRLAKFPSENPNPIVRVDKTGIILYANRASSPVLNTWGREVEQQIPEDWQEQIASALQSGHLLEKEMVCEGRIFSFTLAPITDKGYVNIYASDITDRKRAEAELRASEEKYRSLIESSNSVITAVDFDGRIHFANQIAALQLGCEPADIIGKNMKDLLPPEIADKQLTHIRHVITKGESLVLEAPNLINGRTRWFLNNIQPVRDSSGQALLAMVNSQDITERKRAEEKLQENERTLKLFVDYAPAAIAMFDLDMKYIAFSRRYIIDYRLHDENLVGRSHYEVFPETPERWKEIHRRCLAGATEKADDDPFPRADGTLDWVQWEIQPWYTGSSEIGGIILFSEVITAQKQAEKAIFESERQMRALVTSLDDIVFELDEEGTYLNVWTSDESLLAQPKDKILGKKMVDILGGEYGEQFSEPLKRAISSGIPESIEYSLKLKGKQHWFVARISPILTMEGSYRTASMIIRDITVRKEAEKQLHLHLKRMNALSEIDRAIASSQDMRLSLDALLTQSLSQLGVDAALVLLLSSYDQTLDYKLAKGFRTLASRESHVRLGEGLAGWVGLERKLLHIPDLAEAGESFTRTQMFKGEGFKVYFGVPLIAKGMLKGVLEIYNRDSLEPDLEWLNYLETLGGQAAIAIDNAQLFEGMQQSNLELVTAYDATIEGWSKAMDLRDKETEGHSQRVTELTLKLANKMGIKPQELVNIRRGALLHDIGKLGVPDHILFKPEALNEDEWESMRQHPTYAYNMLMPIKYLNPALDIPYCHHEKWDGSGYPRGLKGEQIPLAARVFAVVDVWDALRSDRPYRSGWSSQKARQYILVQSGKHFDPKVVEIFMRMIEDE